MTTMEETGTSIEAHKTPKKTRQWIKYELYEAMQRVSQLRQDLETSVQIIDHGARHDGKMVQVEITINNVGKTVFLARYTHFMICSVESMCNHVTTLNF
jgi:hypothetical protein